MAGRFTNLKIRSLTSGRVGRYLLYAIGEIILVVVGILIALNINNHNEKKREKLALASVLSNVAYDLKRDTLLVNRAIKNYGDREKVLDKIVKDEYTLEDYKRCLFCPSLITSYFPMNINDKGYLQLKSFNQINSVQQDTLSADVVQFYNVYISFLDELGAEVKDNTIDNIEHWKNNYPWFSTVMNGKADPRFLEYISEDQDFRNRATYYNMLANKNYLPILKKYKKDATEILIALEAREKKNSN